ncbi:MAG TPA: DUF4249 domain-containing protein [Mucilaginibacter sp.]
MIRLRHILPVLFALLVSCKKPYNPHIVAAPDSYLVVEGVINPGSDTTIIKLSRTVNVDSKKTSNPELSAIINIEDSQGNTWQLNSDGTGRYLSAGVLNLPLSSKYRLDIATTDGEKYQSDFIDVKPTPPIDSIGYNIRNGNLQIYVNAHDAGNSTRCYRWEYNETWQFNTKYSSSLVADTVTNKLTGRRPDQQVFNCFGNDRSTNILLGSTAGLSSDVVYQNILTSAALSSEKLETKYSIIVRQYALTADAFQFYTLLKKNTEDLGTIFGELPSELVGNVHCISNPAKIALGYITATNVQSKRIFIPNSTLPPTPTVYPYDCLIDSTRDGSIFFGSASDITPIAFDSDKGVYIYSSAGCTDCTIRGTTQIPSFWK